MTDVLAQAEAPAADSGRAAPSVGRTVRALSTWMVVLHVLIVAWFAFTGFFYAHDDYLIRARAAWEGWLSPALLVAPWDGHLMPAALAAAQVPSKLGNFDYGWVAAMLVAMSLVVGVLLRRFLLRHFGDRPRILLPLGLYVLSIPVLQATVWWAAAINMVPLLACIVLASDGALRRASAGSGGTARILLAAGVGLCFFEKAVLIAPLVVGLLWTLTPGSGGSALRAVVRRDRWVIAGLVAQLAVWSVVYSAVYPDRDLRMPSTAVLGDQLGTGLVQGFLPSLAGGPWRWESAGTGYDVVQISAVLQGVLLAFVAVGLVLLWRRGPRAARSIVVLVLYCLSALLLVNIGRQDYPSIAFAVPRYFADLTVVTAIVLALSTMRLSRDPAPEMLREPVLAWSGRHVLAAAVAVQLLVVSFAASAVGLNQRMAESSQQPWVASALATTRDLPAGEPVLDGTVPDPVLWAFYYPSTRFSRFFAATDIARRFQDTVPRLTVYDGTGALVPGHVEGLRSRPGPVPECGYLLRDRPVRLPMESEVIPWAHVVQVAFIATKPSLLEIRPDAGSPTTVSIPAGLSDVFTYVDGGGWGYQLTALTPGASVCVDVIRVGSAVPGPLPEQS